MDTNLFRSALAALVLTAVLGGCGDGDGEVPQAAPPITYPAELEVPSPREYSASSDVFPGEDDGIAELKLDSGVRVALWIDPDDIRRVLVQHSDPGDPAAWTEPEEIFTAGDGCLIMDAATDGEIVAVGLGCYEDDAFIQQAPDEGAALVTTDLRDWEASERFVEFYSKPEIGDGVVTFVNGVYEDHVVTWTEDDGFEEDRAR